MQARHGWEERDSVFRCGSNGSQRQGAVRGERQSVHKIESELNLNKNERKGSGKLKQFRAARRRCMTRSQEVNQGQRVAEREGNELCAQGGQTERGVDNVQCCVITVGYSAACYYTD